MEKEKLIELLKDDDCPLLWMQGDVGNLADYLIANGVTVQRWMTKEELKLQLQSYRNLKAECEQVSDLLAEIESKMTSPKGCAMADFAEAGLDGNRFDVFWAESVRLMKRNGYIQEG